MATENLFGDELPPFKSDPTTGSDIVTVSEFNPSDGGVMSWSRGSAFARAIQIYVAANRQRVSYRVPHAELRTALEKGLSEINPAYMLKQRTVWGGSSGKTEQRSILTDLVARNQFSDDWRDLLAQIDSLARSAKTYVPAAGDEILTLAKSTSLVAESFYVGPYADKATPVLSPGHKLSPWAGPLSHAFQISPYGGTSDASKHFSETADGAVSLATFLALFDSPSWTTAMGVDCPEDHPLVAGLDTDKRTAVGQRVRERAQLLTICMVSLLYRIQAARWSWEWLKPWYEAQKTSTAEIDRHLLNTRVDRYAEAMARVPLHPLLHNLTPSRATVSFIDGSGPALLIPCSVSELLANAIPGNDRGYELHRVGPLFAALVDVHRHGNSPERRRYAQSLNATISAMQDVADDLNALNASLPGLMEYAMRLAGFNSAPTGTQPAVDAYLDRLQFGWVSEDGMSVDSATVLGGMCPTVPIASEYARPLVPVDRIEDPPSISVFRIPQRAPSEVDIGTLTPPAAVVEPWEAVRVRGDWTLFSSMQRYSLQSIASMHSRTTLSDPAVSRTRILDHIACVVNTSSSTPLAPKATPGRSFWRLRPGMSAAQRLSSEEVYRIASTDLFYLTPDSGSVDPHGASSAAELVPAETAELSAISDTESRFIVGGPAFPRLTFTLVLQADPNLRSEALATRHGLTNGIRPVVRTYRRATRSAAATGNDPAALVSATAYFGMRLADEL